MALTEETIVDKIEILADGQIQVRRANIVKRDGVEIARTNHREVLPPNSPIPQGEGILTEVAQAIWTPERVEAYVTKITPIAEEI